MSGTFGFDGYIYQSIVSVYLMLNTVNDFSDIDKIEIEVRRKDLSTQKDTYNVDLIIYRGDGKAVVHEIKGGKKRINISREIDPNFEAIAKEFENNKSYTPQFQIVCKDASRLTNITSEHTVVVLKNSINYSAGGFTQLENDTIVEIEKFCKNYCQVDTPTHDMTRKIMFSLRHLIEYKIQQLAEDLRRGSRVVENASITMEEILSHPVSFAEVIKQGYPGNPLVGNKFSEKVVEEIKAKYMNVLEIREASYGE